MTPRRPLETCHLKRAQTFYNEGSSNLCRAAPGYVYRHFCSCGSIRPRIYIRRLATCKLITSYFWQPALIEISYFEGSNAQRQSTSEMDEKMWTGASVDSVWVACLAEIRVNSTRHCNTLVSVLRLTWWSQPAHRHWQWGQARDLARAGLR